MSSCQHVNPTN